MLVLVAAAALLGLSIGSFLNVVIYRVPAGLSVVRPGSACPNCSSPVRARHNIPLLSWIALRGRCADCAAPIALRYPIIEAGTALLFVAVVVRLEDSGMLAAVPAYLFFSAAAVALAVIDLDTMRLPNAIVYPSYAMFSLLLVGAAMAQSTVEPLIRAGIGAVAMFAVYFVIAMAKSGGMGMGDVKFAGLIGAALGFVSYSNVVVGLAATFLVGGIAAGVVLVVRRSTRNARLPFGPAMVVGTFIALFAGAPISTTYLSLTHLVHSA